MGSQALRRTKRVRPGTQAGKLRRSTSSLRALPPAAPSNRPELWMLSDQWRDEADHLSERHGLGGRARTLNTCADDLTTLVEAFMHRTVPRDQIAELTGYDDRSVSRWLKDGQITLNAHGEASVLDLPCKPGHLPKLLGFDPED